LLFLRLLPAADRGSLSVHDSKAPSSDPVLNSY
jgi:hypothetical protein